MAPLLGPIGGGFGAASVVAAGGAADAASSAAFTTTSLEDLVFLELDENLTMVHLAMVVLEVTFGATTNPVAADAMLQLDIFFL